MGVPPVNETVSPSASPSLAAHTHPMCTRSHASPAPVAVTQNALIARLNNILSRSYKCVLSDPRKRLQYKLSLRKIRPRVHTHKALPFLPFCDPYKYSNYPTADHSDIQPGPFHYLIGDGFFDVNSDPNDFQFEDLIPILKEDKKEYDLDAAFRCYEADTDYRDEGDE